MREQLSNTFVGGEHIESNINRKTKKYIPVIAQYLSNKLFKKCQKEAFFSQIPATERKINVGRNRNVQRQKLTNQKSSQNLRFNDMYRLMLGPLAKLVKPLSDREFFFAGKTFLKKIGHSNPPSPPPKKKNLQLEKSQQTGGFE